MTTAEVSAERLAGMIPELKENIRLMEHRLAKSAIPEDGWDTAPALADAKLKLALATELQQRRSSVVTGEMVTGHYPSLEHAYISAVTALRTFDDAANVEETNWSGWGEQTIPHSATMRRVKAGQALSALRDADPRMFTAALSSQGQVEEDGADHEQEAVAANRDIWGVANQLSGYVGPSTPEPLASFMMRESAAAAALADQIVAAEAQVTALTKRVGELEGALDQSASRFDGIRGAVESNQVVDKDVHGTAVAARVREPVSETPKTEHVQADVLVSPAEVTDEMVEAAAKALVVAKGTNPLCLFEFNVFTGQEPFDHEDATGRRYIYAWRKQVENARAALSAALKKAGA